MPKLKEIYFPSSTGVNTIYARMWMPDGEVKGTLQIVHGIAEHCKRYDDFANFMANNGFVVVTDDHLGHGNSIGDPSNRGFFAEENGWAYVVADEKSLFNQMKHLYPDVKHVILGHSMGSFMTRTYILKYPNDFDAVIISGTGNQAKLMVDMGHFMAQSTVNSKGPRYVSESLANIMFMGYNKGFDAKNGETAWLSRDKSVVAKYDADPTCGWTATCSLYRDMMDGIQFISDKKNIKLINKNTPMYLMSGAEDPVGEKGKGVKKAYKAYVDAGVKDISIVLYPGGRHEMLNEINKEQVYRDVLSWINSKI